LDRVTRVREYENRESESPRSELRISSYENKSRDSRAKYRVTSHELRDLKNKEPENPRIEIRKTERFVRNSLNCTEPKTGFFSFLTTLDSQLSIAVFF